MKALYKNKYRVASARLQGYNYASPGWYFVTMCTKNREHFFGHIENHAMVLSEIGKIADKFWREIPIHFPHTEINEFVVMPNHVHGIIHITVMTQPNNVVTQNFASLLREKNIFGPQSRNLSSVIRGYKIGVKKWTTMNKFEFSWQSRFHDHIIRDDNSLRKIRKYIKENPMNWAQMNSEK